MLTGFYPEMNEKRPADATIDARLCHSGRHYLLKTTLTLKGRGIRLLNNLIDSFPEQDEPEPEEKK